MTVGTVPASTGIGAPGTQPAPASLAKSPMSSAPNASSSAIPFTRASSMASMRDANFSLAANGQTQIQLQTNAFLQYIIADVALLTSGNSASVAFAADAPWSLINLIRLDDPAGQSIIAPITGYQLYLCNKYLPDTGCQFDPKLDPQYKAVTGTGATGGSISFRLVIPVEYRERDALGALNNSAANSRYLLTVNAIPSFASLYTTPPTTEATSFSVQLYQTYWTSPPGTITTSAGAVATQQTPAGLGTVGFIRYEQHNDVGGGGTPQFQLTNVGDFISAIIFVLRDSGARDIYTPPQSSTNANWPPEFDFWVNDFQVHALSAYGPLGSSSAFGQGGAWPRGMARFYGYTAAYESAGGLDNGVYVLYQLYGLFDKVANFGPANQLLPTDATTKLQIRGSTWGSGSTDLEVITRLLRPVSGPALFS